MDKDETMEIEINDQDTVTILVLRGRLDTNSSAEAENRTLDLIHQGKIRIVFDFSNVEYISSAGLRVVLKAAKHVQAAGGDMAIFGMRDKIREVFEMSGFLKILTVRERREEAVSAVAD